LQGGTIEKCQFLPKVDTLHKILIFSFFFKVPTFTIFYSKFFIQGTSYLANFWAALGQVLVRSHSCYLLTNSFLEILDVNFVANLVFNRIGDKKIYIGPYPQSLNDFKEIAKEKINSILNVQSDKDLIFRQINHKLQLNQAKSLGIRINRYPIEDFNQEDLAEKLKGAGDLLNKLLKEGNTVYVHCTAGMSRAAATVIIYLILYENFTVEETTNFCKKHRPVICPNYGVINKIASIYKPGSEMKNGNIINYIPSSFKSKLSQEIEKERERELEREK
jgi:protein-tyrosine phosphatase